MPGLMSWNERLSEEHGGTLRPSRERVNRKKRGIRLMRRLC